MLSGIWNPNSLTRDQTHVPCVARQILNHWAAREAPIFQLLQASLILCKSTQEQCSLMAETAVSVLTSVLWCPQHPRPQSVQRRWAPEQAAGLKSGISR